MMHAMIYYGRYDEYLHFDKMCKVSSLLAHKGV